MPYTGDPHISPTQNRRQLYKALTAITYFMLKVTDEHEFTTITK